MQHNFSPTESQITYSKGEPPRTHPQKKLHFKKKEQEENSLIRISIATTTGYTICVCSSSICICSRICVRSSSIGVRTSAITVSVCTTTIIAKASPAPTSHSSTTRHFLHIEVTFGTPFPQLLLSKVPQHDVLLPLIVSQFLILCTLNAVVPGNLTLRTKQSKATRALRLGNHLFSIVKQQRRAILKRAIELL